MPLPLRLHKSTLNFRRGVQPVTHIINHNSFHSCFLASLNILLSDVEPSITVNMSGRIFVVLGVNVALYIMENCHLISFHHLVTAGF